MNGITGYVSAQSGRARFYLAVILSVWLSGCQPHSRPTHFSGYIEAEFVTVSAPDAGWIEAPQWQYGQTVQVGALLARFDSHFQQYQLDEAVANAESLSAQLNDALHGARSEEIAVLESQLDEQQFTVEEAKLELTRLAALREKALATQADYDKAVLNLKALEAAAQVTAHQIEVQMLAGRPDYLDSLRQQLKAADAARQQAAWKLEQRILRSRIDGTIKEIYARVGEYVNAAQPVLLIQLADTAKVRFYVPEAELGSIRAGQTVTVRQDGTDTVYTATIGYISQRAEYTPPVLYSEKARQDLVFMAEANFSAPAAFHPGQPVSVTLQ